MIIDGDNFESWIRLPNDSICTVGAVKLMNIDPKKLIEYGGYIRDLNKLFFSLLKLLQSQEENKIIKLVLLNYKDCWMFLKVRKKKIKLTDLRTSIMYNACTGLTIIDLERYKCFQSTFFHLSFLEDAKVLNWGELIRFKMEGVGVIGGACTMGLQGCVMKLVRGVAGVTNKSYYLHLSPFS